MARSSGETARARSRSTNSLWARPGPGLLEDFLKLVRRPDEAVLAYARRWGPLWLCRHGEPWRNHQPECGPAWDEADDEEDEEVAVRGYWERTSDWRLMANEAAATIRIARQVQAGRLARLRDWETLRFLNQVLLRTLMPDIGRVLVTMGELEQEAFVFGERDELARRLYPTDEEIEEQVQRSLNSKVKGTMDLVRTRRAIRELEFEKRIDRYGREQLGSSLEVQRRLLSEVLNHWLEQGGVKPRLDWRPDRPEILLGGWGLLGAIAVQLLFDCSRTDGLVVCTACGTPFLPAFRRPRRDRNPYCSDCGMRAAARDAAARYRQTAKYRATYEKWQRQRRGQPAS